MKINKKTLAKELSLKLREYSEMVDFCEFKRPDEIAEGVWRAKGHAVQELAMTIFGVEEMCCYWRKGLIEKLEKIAKG